MSDFDKITQLTQWFTTTKIKLIDPVKDVVFIQRQHKIGNLVQHTSVPVQPDSKYISPLNIVNDSEVPNFYPLDVTVGQKIKTDSTIQIAYLIKHKDGKESIRTGNGHYFVINRFILDNNIILICDNNFYFTYNAIKGTFAGKQSSLIKPVAIQKTLENLFIKEHQIKSTENGGSMIHQNIKHSDFEQLNDTLKNLEVRTNDIGSEFMRKCMEISEIVKEIKEIERV